MSGIEIKNGDYLGGYAECYIISENRTKEYLYRFLDRFLPDRHVFQDEFQVPNLANHPSEVFSSAEELIDYLEEHPEEPCYLCWKSLKDDELPFADCTFTSDGYLILGLSCKRKPIPGDGFLVDWSIAKKYYRELQEFTINAPGYITLEEPPPENSTEFLINCEKYRQSKEPI